VLYLGVLASDGSSPVIAVTANEPWTLSSNASWVTPSSTTGNPGADIPVTLSVGRYDNTTEDRSATVTVTLANLSEMVVITQERKIPTLFSSTVTLNYNGVLIDGGTPVFNITSTSAWTAITTESWIHITTTSGVESTTEAFFTADPNTTAATRYVIIDLTNDDGLSAIATVVQTTDDGESIGYTYLTDDFDWVIPFGGPRDIEEYNETADAVVTNTLNMYSYANASAGIVAGDLLAAYTAHGYTDINPGQRSVYFASHYLKFGKNNAQSGIQRTIPIASGRSANVTLTFDATPCITGSANFDKVLLVVEIDGPGAVNVDDGLTKRSANLDIQLVDKSPEWEWKTKSVVIYGITSATKITIKTNKTGTDSGTFRFYLDNLKFEKHSVVTP
jgi:hypothetical protein